LSGSTTAACLSFITSNKWFRAKYGADLRQYMATHTRLCQIIDFGDEAVFDALAYPTIVIATKRGKPVALSEANNEVLALNWDGGNEAFRVSDFPEVFAAERFAVPQSELKPGGWQLEPPVKRRLLERLRKAGQPLGEYCKGRFYRGVLTGLNEAFVITREQRDALVKQDPQSAEIIKPFLHGRDVKRWNVESQDLWLLFTRRGVEIDRYPAIKAHLNAFREQLEPKPDDWDDKRQGAWRGRKAGSYEWFHIQDNIAYWEEFLLPKIIVPAITDNVNYAPDLTGYFSNDKTSIVVSDDWPYLMTILNSTVSWWLTQQLFSSKQGGFFELKPMYVATIPIPQITPVQRGVIKPLVYAAIQGISRPEYERLLNGLVYELFFPEDLHAKHIRLFDACAAAGIRAGLDAKAVAALIFRNDHPIYGMLFDLPTLDVVRIIESLE
jgi:adenine-specific DNA-methyltransferase